MVGSGSSGGTGGGLAELPVESVQVRLDQVRFESFRFVIIGAGSAGCLLARRLAIAGVGQVLLIEASPSSNDRDVRSVVPAYYARTFGSRLDWSYATVPQAGLASRRIAWPRGRVLGGCGAINALIHLQASPADFDRWSSAGCSGWDWQSLNVRSGSSAER